MRRFTADGDGRRLRLPAAPVAAVYLCGTAPGDGVRHGGHGCRPSGPPPPPRSDRSGPPPPASSATATTDRPPPSTRRGGGSQLAGQGGRAVATAHGGPHSPPPPGRRPTASMTRSTAPAGTRSPHPPHDARRRQSGAGRQRPGGGGLAVAAACRSPNRPAARGERARPLPGLPKNRRHACHYTHYSPTTAPDTPPHPTTPVAAPNTPPPPATPAAAPTARPPLHPTLARTPPHQPPRRPHACHRTLQSPALHHTRRRTYRTPATARSERAQRHTQVPTTSNSPCPPAAADTVPAVTGSSRRAGHSGRPPRTATPSPHPRGPNPMTRLPRCQHQKTQHGSGPQPAHRGRLAEAAARRAPHCPLRPGAGPPTPKTLTSASAGTGQRRAPTVVRRRRRGVSPQRTSWPSPPHDRPAAAVSSS